MKNVLKEKLLSLIIILNFISFILLGGLWGFSMNDQLTIDDLKNQVTNLTKQINVLNSERDSIIQSQKKFASENKFLKSEMRRLQQEQDLSEIKTSERNLKHSEIAARRILSREGIYSNDPNDRGGETCYGVSRVHFPDHEIWKYVDEIKKKLEKQKKLNDKNISQEIENNSKILNLASEKYIRQWNAYGLDKYPFKFSETFFDILVNCGDGNGTRFLQSVLNGFNHNNRFGDDLEVDGGFGKKTKELLQTAIELGYHDRLTTGLISMKKSHYITLAMNNQDQRRYINGWFNR